MNELIPFAAGLAAGYVAGDPRTKQSLDYGKYVAKHKYHVISPMRQMGLGWGQALKHDLSKLTPSEFGPYRDWFEGDKGLKGSRDPETFKRWRTAVDHHYQAPGNQHHYRKLTTPVSDKYKLEAVADWYAVGRAKGTVTDSFPVWYDKVKDNLPIQPKIRKIIDKHMTKKAEAILTKYAGAGTLALISEASGARKLVQDAKIKNLISRSEQNIRHLIKSKNKAFAARKAVLDDLRKVRN